MLCFLDDGIGMDPSKFTPESGGKTFKNRVLLVRFTFTFS